MFPVLCSQSSIHGLESVETLALAGSSQQTVTITLALHQSGSVHQRLRCVPDNVTDWLLGVDPEEVLQDGEEGDLLGSVLHPVEHGVEHVQVRREVHIMRSPVTSLVTLTLLIKHIALNFQIGVLAFALDILENLQQLQTCNMKSVSMIVDSLYSSHD